MVKVSQQKKADGTGRKCLVAAVVFLGLVVLVMASELYSMSHIVPGNSLLDCPELSSSSSPLRKADDATKNEAETTVPAVSRSTTEKNFLEIAQATGTDKVQGQANWDKGEFKFKDAINPRCRTWGHFYHTMYQKWIGKYSTADAEPIQFLEIGYSNGNGFAAFLEFLPNAELHSIEYQCNLLEQRQADKAWHKELTAKNRFHCGDSSNIDFLMKTYDEMRQEGAPPLQVVVEDASHLSAHQAAAVFFWFPRLAPNGLLIVEDVQPNGLSNTFREEFFPQLLMDLHYCGDPKPANPKDVLCFPTLQPLLKSVHCEMHICVLERNELPAVNLSKEESMPPPNALNLDQCRQKKKEARSKQ